MSKIIGYVSDDASGTLRNAIRSMRAAIKLAETANSLYCGPAHPGVLHGMMAEAVDQSRRASEALDEVFKSYYKY